MARLSLCIPADTTRTSACQRGTSQPTPLHHQLEERGGGGACRGGVKTNCNWDKLQWLVFKAHISMVTVQHIPPESASLRLLVMPSYVKSALHRQNEDQLDTMDHTQYNTCVSLHSLYGGNCCLAHDAFNISFLFKIYHKNMIYSTTL